MKLWHKGIAVLSCTAMLTSLLAGSAMAKEEREKITKITLSIESSIEVGDDSSDVSVSVESGNCTVDEVEITNDDGEWKSGDQPKVKITLEADSDYYFSSSSSSTFKFTGDSKTTYVSSSRKDSNSTMIVNVKLKALEGDLSIDSVEWEDEKSSIATWEESDGASSYQVRLYRGSSSVSEAVTTTNTYYNFTSLFTKTGEYSFRVRALGSGSKKGDWMESDSFYVDEDELARIQSGYYSNGYNSSNNSPGSNNQQSGSWQQDGVGWWYRNANGTYTTNGWQQINNLWYCFDSVGYMRTGWIQSANVWYYCDNSTGAMLTNTTTPDGYRVDANGVWVQ